MGGESHAREITEEVSLDQSRVKPFRAALRGDLIGPEDDGYGEARKVYNGMIDRYPRLIARCADVADVIAAVRFARENDLLVSVRGGGHNAGGLGVCDGGLVIDLSRMRGVRVDPKARTARVEGGCVWGDVDHATHAFGLAVPGGIISTTGVAGLTLGGGLGHLTRKCGLTIDNLLAADLVLADGRFVTASAGEHEDLFWAIRGGGGNFGVVTSFEFRCHPVDTVMAGPMLWDLDRAAEAMGTWRDFITGAPEDVNGFFVFAAVEPGPPFPEHLHNKAMAGVIWCYTGKPERLDEILKPIRAVPPAFDLVGPMPYPALQSMLDPFYPPGLQWYWKGDFVKRLPDEAIDRHVKHGSRIPTPLSGMHLYPINGAAHRVGASDTAWSYRDALWAEVIVGVDPDPANRDRIVAWARDYWEDLHPYAEAGAYVNVMMDDEGQERVKATYRDNYERLAAIKKTYDPDNFFRVNQNIRPNT
jgi:FAD/FMN-containing dehydrogenase